MLFGQLNILLHFRSDLKLSRNWFDWRKKFHPAQCGSSATLQKETIIFSTSDLGLIQICLKHHQSSLNQPKPSVLKLNRLVLQKQKCLKKTSISRMKLIVNETIKHHMEHIQWEISLQKQRELRPDHRKIFPKIPNRSFQSHQDFSQKISSSTANSYAPSPNPTDQTPCIYLSYIRITTILQQITKNHQKGKASKSQLLYSL